MSIYWKQNISCTRHQSRRLLWSMQHIHRQSRKGWLKLNLSKYIWWLNRNVNSSLFKTLFGPENITLKNVKKLFNKKNSHIFTAITVRLTGVLNCSMIPFSYVGHIGNETWPSHVHTTPFNTFFTTCLNPFFWNSQIKL